VTYSGIDRHGCGENSTAMLVKTISVAFHGWQAFSIEEVKKAYGN
jgi:hypothetical protein